VVVVDMLRTEGIEFDGRKGDWYAEMVGVISKRRRRGARSMDNERRRKKPAADERMTRWGVVYCVRQGEAASVCSLSDITLGPTDETLPFRVVRLHRHCHISRVRGGSI